MPYCLRLLGALSFYCLRVASCPYCIGGLYLAAFVLDYNFFSCSHPDFSNILVYLTALPSFILTHLCLSFQLYVILWQCSPWSDVISNGGMYNSRLSLWANVVLPYPSFLLAHLDYSVVIWDGGSTAFQVSSLADLFWLSCWAFLFAIHLSWFLHVNPSGLGVCFRYWCIHPLDPWIIWG